MRVGVMGGTFDPPHIGHLVAAEEARIRLRLEQVVFVPAGTPPHKLDEPVTPVKHRLEMVTRAVAANPYFVVSRVDVDRPGPSYTVDTLLLLREQWGGDARIYFIMGMDSLADLPNWHEPERIIQLCHLAVVDRPGYDADIESLERILPGLSRRVEFVPMPQLEISSTDLAERVRQGLPIRYQVPPAVEEYIYAHRLYI